MEQATAPSPAEFHSGALEHFGFLLSAYGFSTLEPADGLPTQFISYFAKPTVFVAVIGYSYGFALGVELGSLHADGSIAQSTQLHILIRMRKPELLAPRFGGSRGQLEQMAFQASALKTCADDLLRGDLSVLETARSVAEALTSEANVQTLRQEQERAAAKAAEAFHAGQHRKALELLLPFARSLSPAQATMLRIAMARAQP